MKEKIIYNKYGDSIRYILKDPCKYRDVEIIERYLVPEHVHMLVSISPKISVSSFIGYLKEKVSL